MKQLKNEGGYALVTVLLIITIFMIVFLSFMGQSFSSVKQNQVVEKSSQSIAIAEMGMSYYQVAVKNVFTTKKDYYNDMISKGTGNPTVSVMINDITNAINNELNLGRNKKDIDSTSYYKVNDKPDNLFAKNINGKIIINFTVTGEKDKKTSSLNTDMYIDLTGLNITTGGGIPVSSVIPIINKPILDLNIDVDKNCIDPVSSYDLSKCTKGIIINNPDTQYTSNFQGYGGTIYVANKTATGTLTMGGVGNKSKLKVLSNNLIFEKNMINVTETTIEVRNDLTTKDHFTATKANFLIGGNLTAEEKFELQDNAGSQMYYTLIMGNMTFPSNHNLVIGSNNTMCVRGKLSGGIAEIRGKLYISKGNDNFGFMNNDKTSKNNIVYVNENLTTDQIKDIQDKCGNTFASQVNNITWGENAQTYVDNIIYQ